MDGVLIVPTLLVAHEEGAARQVDHLRGFEVLLAAVLAYDDKLVAEATQLREARIRCASRYRPDMHDSAPKLGRIVEVGLGACPRID